MFFGARRRRSVGKKKWILICFQQTKINEKKERELEMP